MENMPSLEQTFTAAAESVSAVVSRVSGMAQAFAYALELCEGREACELLLSGSREAFRKKTKQKVIAAPMLGTEEVTQLAKLCEARGIGLIRDGLRDYVAGIDVSLTRADYGIAETGTLVIDSSSEELRLATMVSEVHVAILPANRLRATSLDLGEELAQAMGAAPSYLAFITGASRTADIERVLALGVHGPVELHILLLDA